MRDFLKEIKERVLIYDGSKGYMLQKLGMKGGECPELWNATHRDDVMQIYRSYKEAGSDVIQTNTFQGNRLRLEEYGLGDRTYELNNESARLAKSVMGDDGFVAASIGPIGELFEPSGELTFQRAYEIYKEQVKALADAGVDIINFETFTDVAEMRAALLAAKENTSLPVICSISFEANGKTLMGTDPYVSGIILKSLGADMIGTNCSLGPEHLLNIVKKMSEVGGIYLSVKPNAGLPEMIDGKVVYRETPENFAGLAGEFVKYGVRLIGGCCGTTPEFISEVKAKLKNVAAKELEAKSDRIIASGVKHLTIESMKDVYVGRINAKEDVELHNELTNGNLEYIVDRALDLACEGYDAVCFDIDGISSDSHLLANVVNTAQGYLREPFIIRTESDEALENALRIYKGKAGVSVKGFSDEEAKKLTTAAKKYGAAVIDY